MQSVHRNAALAMPGPARQGSLRRLLGATASPPSPLARLAQQLRGLRQFRSAPSAPTDAAHQPAARGGRQPAPTRQAAGAGAGGRPGAGGGRRPGIVWFRGDLRLHDHEALTRAQAECSSLLPVYCFDPREYGKSPQGYDKTGPYRAQFLLEAVADLRTALRAAGSELLVRVGRPEEVVAALVRRTGAAAVYCHTEVTYEELRTEAAVKAAVEAAGAGLKPYWANTLCHLQDLPFRLDQLPQNFDTFRERVEGAAVRAALPAPCELRGLPLGGRLDPGELPTLRQLGLQPLAAGGGGEEGGGPRGGGEEGGSPRGGEGEALRQLARFLAAAGGGARAAGACGAAYCSNFSSSIAPWLATGCLSPRRMLEDARGALAAAGAGGPGPAAAAAALAAPQAPLAWVRFELLWRDFFRLMTLAYSSKPSAQLGRGASAAVAAA